MTTARDHRRCALQALYQLDAVADVTTELLRESLEGSGGGDAAREAGLALALAAWEARAAADEVIARFADDWPVYRQPIIDRNVLRLGHYEMVTGETPPKVAINEAIELAREFGSEKSTQFVNAVLDRMHRELTGVAAPEATDVPETEQQP